MSARTARLTAVAAWLLLPLVWGPLAVGQEGAVPDPLGGDEAAAPRATASATRDVGESRPVLYYLKDEQGRLVPVPGFTIDEFEELYQLREKLAEPDRQPRYVLQSVSVDGTAGAGAEYAELAVRLKVLTREEGWIRVPLGFDRSFLVEPADHNGPGEGLVQYEDASQGYVGWIRGAAGEEHEFRLKLLTPLADVGDETRLRLLAPRATVSQLTLKVPVAEAAGRVSQGAGLLTSSGGDGQTTDFSVLGLGGDFEMTWRRPTRQTRRQHAALEVEGTILARIDARGVDAEATLRVHGSGAPLDSLRVRLPPGAALIAGVPSGTAGYSVAPVEDTEDIGAAEGTQQRRLVEIRLAEGKTDPIEIRLATRRPHDFSQPGEWLELAGFEVVGAVRQWGHIDVAADSDWQVLWGSSGGVRQVEPLPLAGVVAGFDYDAQPCSLTARLVPKRTRISVEPEYRLLLDADRVQLEARLMYTIRGARAFSLDVAMPAGWESIEVEPETLVAVDGIAVNDDRVLSIPLLQPSTGKMELRLSAQWLIPEGSTGIELPLPQPQADWPGAAAVSVVAADNVEVIPNHESMVNLIRQPVGPAMEIPAGHQPPVFYRAEAAEAVYAADLRVHARQIAADVASRVALDTRGGRVEQTLAFTIGYEPADSITVRVPRRLAESGELEFRCEGLPLVPAVRPGAAISRDASQPMLFQLDLPHAYLGACEVEVAYPLRLAELAPGFEQLAHGQPVVLAIPLVMPGEGRLASNRLEVTAPPDVIVRVSDEAQTAWQPQARPSGAPPEVHLVTDVPADEVRLEVEYDEREGTTLVERAWVQTWLMAASRQDRAVFSFSSNQRELVLIVPPGTDLDRVQVFLDGREVAARTDDDRLIVPLSGETTEPRRLLDVRCVSTEGRRSPGRLSIELPHLAGDVQGGRLYWQFVVPRDEHLVATPPGLTNEFTWNWDGVSWGRRPLLDPSDLATWVGLKPSVDDAPQRAAMAGVNCYLFSSIEGGSRWELRTAWRFWLVLGGSGVVLLGGLLLIYVPRARHPAGLLLVAVALLAFGSLYYPEPALLLAQAASLGLVLALLAGLLAHSVVGRHRAPPLESLSVVLESASTQTHYPVPATGGPASTQAAPAVEAAPSPDSDA